MKFFKTQQPPLLALTSIFHLLLFTVGVSFGQSVTQNTQENFNFFYKKAFYEVQSNINEAKINAFKADSLGEGKSEKYRVNYLLGYIFTIKKDYKKSNFYYERALSYTESEDQKSTILTLIVKNHLSAGDIRQAMDNALRANVMAVNQAQRYESNYLLGYIYHYKKEFAKSSEYYEKALIYASEDQSISLKNNLIDNYLRTGITDFKKVMSYARTVLRNKIDKKSPYTCNAYGIIGKLYSRQKKIDSSSFYIQRAIKAIPKLHDSDKQIMAGFLATKADVFAENSYLDSAIVFYKQAVSLQETGYKKCEYLLNIANCYTKKSQVSQAQKYLSKTKGLLGNNLHNQMRLYELTAVIQAEKEDRKGLDATYARVEKLIEVNNETLTKADMKKYFAMQKNISDKQKYLATMAQKRIQLQAKTFLNIIFSLFAVIIVSSIYTLYQRSRSKKLQVKLALSQAQTTVQSKKNLKSKQDEKVKKDIKAWEMKTSLKVSHIGKFQKTREINKSSTLNKLKGSDFWPRE